jgi:putative PEP-CTERM system histidine kinase
MLMTVAVACCGALAGAAAFRRRRSVAQWAFVAGMAGLAAEMVAIDRSFASQTAAELIRWQELRMTLATALLAPWWLFSATYSRGDVRGHRTKHRWYLAVIALVAGCVLITRDSLIDRIGTLPASSTTIIELGWMGFAVHVFGLVGSLAIVMNLEQTFRAAVGTMRWRIKFALVAVGLLFVTRIYTNSQVLLFRGFELGLDHANVVATLIAAPLILWATVRTGPHEIDVYPSGSVLKNSLTILVAGLYLLVVGVFARAISALGGTNAFTLKTLIVLLALVVLAVGLQSNRVQWSLRRFVSRHFVRPLHDYRAVWRKFTDGTATRVEPADLCRAVAALIAEVFGVLSIRIWLLDEKRDQLTVVASTTQLSTSGGSAKPDSIDAAPIVRWFAARPDPLDIDTTKGAWCAALRACHRADFRKGGHRLCVPLFVHSQMLGVVTIGDRVNGAAFTDEEFELLKCIADHVAASLLNVHLSHRLLQAKQLEAFQSMAAFFVHDLKNAAATLSLMLQNLPLHFDDAEFRADALRGIGTTVGHINHLIERLSALRSELRIEPVDTDLNEVIAQALAGLAKLPNTTVVKDIHPVPRIRIDRDQVQKVITNLVLNATEAVSSRGCVTVSTRQEDGWVVLTVADNGCGMSDDFIAHSLFRPFQTTKKGGLGIGMYQSKMIIDAHGGRIAVSSTPGTGTEFQVFLRTSPVAVR